MTLTDADRKRLSRIYYRVYRRLEARLQGGLAYGMDFQTIRQLAPVQARVLDSILYALNV
jgi:hypothetical protein